RIFERRDATGQNRESKLADDVACERDRVGCTDRDLPVLCATLEICIDYNSGFGDGCHVVHRKVGFPGHVGTGTPDEHVCAGRHDCRYDALGATSYRARSLVLDTESPKGAYTSYPLRRENGG